MNQKEVKIKTIIAVFQKLSICLYVSRISGIYSSVYSDTTPSVNFMCLNQMCLFDNIKKSLPTD